MKTTKCKVCGQEVSNRKSTAINKKGERACKHHPGVVEENKKIFG